MTKQIELRNGEHALVDDEDYDLVRLFSWCANCDRGVVRSVCAKSKPRISLHGLIMHPPEGYEVDHINGDTTDNRRENLRVCLHKQNTQNKKKRSANTYSRFKGVSRSGKRWRSYITIDGKSKHLGVFATEEEAALTYNAAAVEAWGEYASPNVVGEIPDASAPKYRVHKIRKSASGFKGVSFRGGQLKKHWHAIIHYEGKVVHIGFFDTPEAAARAYDAKARELFGEWAILNFPAEAVTP